MTKLEIPTSRRLKLDIYQVQVEPSRERACWKEEMHPLESECGNYQTHFSTSSRFGKCHDDEDNVYIKDRNLDQ
jgi:hypothetical protein